MNFSSIKIISLSISSAKILGWRRGRGGPKIATPCGENTVNLINFFFLKPKWCNLVDLRHLPVKKIRKLLKINIKNSLNNLIFRCVINAYLGDRLTRYKFNKFF